MSQSTNRALDRHVHAVQRYVSLTAPRYAALFKPGLVTHPICCFGNPAEARIVTVGLNPSDGELTAARNWPNEQIDHTKLAERCRTYFTRPHGWFAPWIRGLASINASYQNGSAVHIDLSSRATRPVSAFNTAWEQKLFLEMLERDLWVFFGTLALCSKAELVMMAGSATGKYYINEFLREFAPDYGCSLDGSFNRLAHPGRGKIAWHTLSGGGRKLKVFFCSSSPSDRIPTLLPQRISEHASELKI